MLDYNKIGIKFTKYSSGRQKLTNVTTGNKAVGYIAIVGMKFLTVVI